MRWRWFRVGLVSLMTMAMAPISMNAQTLAERLGYSAQDKLVIINSDDIGMCHAANAAAMDALQNGLLTSITIMMPCSWVPEIAAFAREHPEYGYGLHLTLTSEWKNYKWGTVAPVDKVPGLLQPSGYMWPDVQPVYEHATPKEAEIEIRAQIEKALKLGIPVDHLDSHMGTLQYNQEYWLVLARVAREYRLPIRMADEELLRRFGVTERRRIAKEMGLLAPDYLVHTERDAIKKPEDVPVVFEKVLRNLKPGVTEIYIHASIDSPELKHITATHAIRHAEYEWVMSDALKQLVKELGIKLISYKPIMKLMRSETQ
ncbi:MAG: polysaccharide deacetylase family protein [candidate division KSB1 bacterium]|nr:polysaccharide deacetylase family protein [candidate division KSB1 bacterium]MDQ7065889.1 polysaccharide deacetylase family protein [candidate division KSB1 bacterium]